MRAMTRTLEQWLDHQQRIHPKSIDMGLERIGAVANTRPTEPGFGGGERMPYSWS